MAASTWLIAEEVYMCECESAIAPSALVSVSRRADELNGLQGAPAKVKDAKLDDWKKGGEG